MLIYISINLTELTPNRTVFFLSRLLLRGDIFPSSWSFDGGGESRFFSESVVSGGKSRFFSESVTSTPPFERVMVASNESAVSPKNPARRYLDVVVAVSPDADDFSDPIPKLGCGVLHANFRANLEGLKLFGGFIVMFAGLLGNLRATRIRFFGPFLPILLEFFLIPRL